MTNPPQPPAPEAADSGEPLDRQLDDIASLLTDDISIARNEARERLKELIAAAVQAESRKLLERIRIGLLAKQFWAADDAYDAGDVVSVDDIRALLDGERRKGGGNKGDI